MTELHLSWLQGPTDNPDPTVDGMSASTHAAETNQDAVWGHLYPKARTPQITQREDSAA